MSLPVQMISVPFSDILEKSKLLSYINNYETGIFLDSNRFASSFIPVTGPRYDFLAAAGITELLDYKEFSFEKTDAFIERAKSKGVPVFCLFSYDLKNQIENLTSQHPPAGFFPDAFLFTPEQWFVCKNNQLQIFSTTNNPARILEEIKNSTLKDKPSSGVRITGIIEKSRYLNQVEKILQHIAKGDVYELNYCHRLQLIAEKVNPVSLFSAINEKLPNPFAAWLKYSNEQLLCFSPERFICYDGKRLLAQPMKGTSARSSDPLVDEKLKQGLLLNEKERSENIMIVDLVRNDLSRIAAKGTVRVNELCGAYSFPGVHQMISSVSCVPNPGTKFTEILRAMFPMGSMTGAPKISAMSLIDRYEDFRRGIYSGTLGYILPSGEFDFNVVIRSMVINTISKNIWIAAGGAITSASDPESEFKESLIKMSGLLKMMGIDTGTLFDSLSMPRYV
jgi:para-aminobenzoate synthetase component I